MLIKVVLWYYAMFIDHRVFSSEAVDEQVLGILVNCGRSAELMVLNLGLQEGAR